MRGEDTDLNQLESVYDDLGNTFTYLLKMMSLAEKNDEFGIFQGDPGI